MEGRVDLSGGKVGIGGEVIVHLRRQCPHSHRNRLLHCRSSPPLETSASRTIIETEYPGPV